MTNIDVLILFAEKDNETTKMNEPGWVSQFKKFLELMLFQVLGTKPVVVIKSEMDTATTVNDVAVLVAVLTKDFLRSNSSLGLLEQFHNNSAGTSFKRVFKVLKSPLTLQEQPSYLHKEIGYEMYQRDAETGQMKEYEDFFGHEAEKQYWMELVNLTYDVYDSLMALKQAESRSGSVKNIFKKKTIYLAETGHDLSIQKNIIKRELQRHGFTVLPNQTLPQNLSDLEWKVRNDIQQCAMSIHLIGSAYGEIPKDGDRSIVDIQNKIASEIALEKKQAKEEFSRLIWISQNLKYASDRQKSFIETIRRDTEAQEGAEILQNPLEDFKNIMREELVESKTHINHDFSSKKSIYLVCDKIDHREAESVKEVIKELGFNVLMPAFEGDLLEVRKRHIENLRNFDQAVIFKGKINDQWVRMKVLDLLKAPGFGRSKPIQGKALVGGADHISSYKNQSLTLISNDSTKWIDNLKIFLQ